MSCQASPVRASCFNPRSPEESDAKHPVLPRPHRHFNPRLLFGRRLEIKLPQDMFKFQSTPSVERATLGRTDGDPHWAVSILAFQGEGDVANF